MKVSFALDAFLVTFNGGFFGFFHFFIQHCFTCHLSESTVSEDAGIQPRTVATTGLAVRRYNHSARSHPSRIFINLFFTIALIITEVGTQTLCLIIFCHFISDPKITGIRMPEAVGIELTWWVEQLGGFHHFNNIQHTNSGTKTDFRVLTPKPSLLSNSYSRDPSFSSIPGLTYDAGGCSSVHLKVALPNVWRTTNQPQMGYLKSCSVSEYSPPPKKKQLALMKMYIYWESHRTPYPTLAYS